MKSYTTTNPDEFRPTGDAGKLEFEYLWSGPEELSKHLGKWVVILGKEIVATATDEDFDRTIAEVRRKNPGKYPMIVKFPKEKVTLF